VANPIGPPPTMTQSLFWDIADNDDDDDDDKDDELPLTP
jgi:hypothetical protein